MALDQSGTGGGSYPVTGTKGAKPTPQGGAQDVPVSNNPYGGYGGYGGSGGSSGPSAEQKKAADNLGGITGYNKDTILGGAKDAGEVFDVQDEQNKRLQAIQTLQNKRQAGNDWYTQQQKLQSVVGQLRDAGGNALTGSNLYDFWDAVARKDDMDDVATLNNMRTNQNTIDNNYYEALSQSTNARNEYNMGIEQALRELAADHAAQMNNISPDLAAKIISGNGADGKTVTPPSWLNTDYFDANKRGPAATQDQGLYRPDTAAQNAWNNKLLNENANDTSQASNKSYWERMNKGYSRRTQ